MQDKPYVISVSIYNIAATQGVAVTFLATQNLQGGANPITNNRFRIQNFARSQDVKAFGRSFSDFLVLTSNILVNT